MKPIRIVGASVLAALGAWLLLAVFRPPPPPAPPRAFTSSRECESCHQTVFAEWQTSWHAQAWIDPEVRTLSNDFANTDCIDCHAPRPVFETGVGKRVLPRETRRAEGVDCIACHLLPDDRIAGTIDAPAAACRPVATRDLANVELCAPCHNQHNTVDQWRASKYATPGPGYQDCLACHMPYRGGDPSKGRDHTMHGGHDMELVRRAVVLRATRVDGKATVEVENVGAGHNYPTDERSRASDLFWRPKGEETWRHLYRFRNPYRFEVDLPNTELASGATLKQTIDDPAAAGDIEVALFYKLSPYWKDPPHPDPEHEAFLVHRAELAP
ncbi:MAG: cytochrome c family protein [Planctomycetes bacterium]|nr:cytochrome c family protein [Planctomycetota bacterium]